MIQELCQDYRQAGGRVLKKLRYLQLGTGFELFFPSGEFEQEDSAAPVEPVLSLNMLLDLSKLEELHLQYDEDPGKRRFGWRPKFTFNTHMSYTIVNSLRLPRL